MRAPRRQGEPGGSGGFGHARQSSEVPRVLQPVQIEIRNAVTEWQGLGAGAGEAGHGQDAARRVRVREIGEELLGDFQRDGRESAADPDPLGRGEKARRRQRRLDLQTARDGLGDQVRPLQQDPLLTLAFTSPEPPNIL